MGVLHKQTFLSHFHVESDGSNWTIVLEKFIEFMAQFTTSDVSKCNKANTSGSTSSDLSDIIESLSREEVLLMWQKVGNIATQAVMSLEGDEEDLELLEQNVEKVNKVLQHVVNIAHATLTVIATSVVPSSLLETAILLHEMLPSLPASCDKLKQSLVQLYSSWWSRGLEGRREVISNTIIYLLQQSVHVKATGTDVKRLWVISDALHLYNKQQLTSNQLQPLLVKCFSAKVFLKSEGVRFLSLVLRLNCEFVNVVHQAIIVELPHSNQATLEIYGNVYFKAWSESSGDIREKIETTCIQDLIYRAVHSQRSPKRSMFSAFYTILHYIHSRKLHSGLDDVIQRLYEPILWRSLKVANGHVRTNAAVLLMDIFPVRNSQFKVEENDLLLQKQFDSIQTLLFDPCPGVRSVTVSGVCSILRSYWEIIPSDMIRSLLTTLTNQLVYDASSPDVRAAVIKGMCELLSQPLSHTILKKILPELCNLIHDTSDKVRVAMCDLLISVRSVRTIKFWTVVPIEHIMSRLKTDSQAVCRKIVQLTHPSFLPLSKPRDSILERCVYFVGSYPAAVRPFYKHAQRHMDLGQKVSYIIMLCRCVLKLVRSADDNNHSQESESRDEEAPDDPDISLNDTQSISCLFDIMAILWSTIEEQLAKPANAEIKMNLQRKFAIALPEFLRVFQNHDINTTLVTLSTYMPHKLVPQLSRSCLSTLRDLPSPTPHGQYSILIEAMVKWGKTGDLLEMLGEWIQAGVDGGVPDTANTEDQHQRKRVGFVTSHKPRPSQGLTYLNALLSHPLSRSTLLQFNSHDVQTIRHTLTNITGAVEKRLDSLTTPSRDDPTTDEFLHSAFVLHHKLDILQHKIGDENNNVCSVLEQEFTWADTTLLPLLRCKKEHPTVDDDMKVGLALKIIMTLLETGRSMLMVGVADQEFSALLSDFCQLCLKTDTRATLLPCISRVLYQICEYTSFTSHDNDEGIGSSSDLISPLFDLVITSLEMVVKADQCTDEMASSLREVIGEIINTTYRMRRQGKIITHVMDNIHSSVVTASIADLCYNSQQGYIEVSETYTDQTLPLVTQILLSTVSKNKAISQCFMDELDKCIKSGALNTLHMVHAALHLLYILGKSSPSNVSIFAKSLLPVLVTIETSLTDQGDDSTDRVLFNKLKSRLDEMAAA